MASRRSQKLEQGNKQNIAVALRTIVEQTCNPELDRGESFFGRANVKQAEERENDGVNTGSTGPTIAGVLVAKRQFLRKKSSVLQLNAAILQGKDIREIKRFSMFDDISSRNEFGKTPLHIAAASQNVDAVVYLIERKVNVNVLDNRGETPLHAAVRAGNVSAVNALVKCPKIDINLCGPTTKTTPLHLVAQLEHPNNARICKLLISRKADLFLRDSHNKTAIAYAAQLGNYELMKCFFTNASEQTEELLYDVDDAGSLLLHLAVSSRIPQAVQLCMDYKAQVDRVKTSDGTTAVHVACALGPVEMVTMILQSVSFKYDYSLVDKNGMTCLHLAAKHNQAQIIELLLSQKMDINPLDKNYKTPLMWAVSRGCNEATEVLLKNDANARLLDHRERTVIHLAVGSHTTLSLLLQNRVVRNLIRNKDRTGSTALHYAAKGGYPLDIEVILSIQNSLAGVQNVDEDTPLHLAVSNGWLKIVQLLLDGTNSRMVNSLDKKERTPLHLAAKNGHVEIVEFLLQTGASIQRDSNGQTPLHLAASTGFLSIVELLLTNNLFSLNQIDKNQETALHLAVQAGHANVVEFLISNKDQELTENTFNKNILDMAIEQNQKAVAMALASHRRWREMFKPASKGCSSQMALLIEKMPEVAERFLDRCIRKEGWKDHPDYKITYNLHYLQGLPDYERCKPKNSLKPLYAMVKHRRLNCIQHPTSIALINVKWHKYGLKMVLINQIMSVLYLCIVIGLVSMLADNPCFQAVDQKNCTIANSGLKLKGDPAWPKRPAIKSYMFLKVALIALSILKLLSQILAMYNQGWRYLTKFSYLLELFLCITMMVFLLPENCSGCFGAGAVAACLAWFSLMSRIARVSFLGIYLMMLEKIILTVIRVFVLMFLFLLCFAFSFYVVDFKQILFQDLLQSIATSFVMLMGEVNYEVIFLEDPNIYHPYLLYTVFILFCISMPIIFLNLLIGLAVGDINSIQKIAALERYSAQVERLYQIEQMFPRFILKRWQVRKHVEYPNRRQTPARRLYDVIAGTLTTFGYEDDYKDNKLEQTVEEQERRLKSISKKLVFHSGQLESMQEHLERIAVKLVGSTPPFPGTIGHSDV